MNNKIAFWKHYPVADQTGVELARETIEWQKKFNFDLVKITPAGSWQATCYGLEDSWNNDFLGRRNIDKRVVFNENDWSKIKEFTSTPKQLEEQIKAVKLVCDEIKNVPVYATVFCPITQAIQLAGIDVLKTHWQNNKEVVKEALRVITKNTILTIQKFNEMGARGLYFVTQAQQNSFFSFEEYTAIGKPWDTECLEVATELFEDVIFHLHGDDIYSCVDNMKNLKLHLEMLENSIEATDNISLPKLIGFPSNDIFSAKNNEDIKQLLDQNQGNSLVTCGCVLPLDYPEDIIKKWIEYIRLN